MSAAILLILISITFGSMLHFWTEKNICLDFASKIEKIEIGKNVRIKNRIV
jgi:hypothetical protein